MLNAEVAARAAAVLAIAVIVNGIVLACIPQVFVERQIAFDWPLIAFYTLFFLAMAVLLHRDGLTMGAIALAMLAIGAAAFDIHENLAALDARKITPSAGKWFCYFGAILIVARWFVPARTTLARVTMALLFFGALAGLLSTYLLPVARAFVLGAAFITSLGLMTAIPILFRR